ncbi:GNAT family N-acetyltransferase [Deinococcus sp. KNUC1210]|uniref:GNAT family N-acetyltransferase n=1 Tax=Deinococcus sp. KNUC1210 TaxID=2917691 RepID=UPI001EF08207|nr:GNAT family N-acetyltransferase [Deinococcus sp. KNUC1210]ULH16093.1 GNAT family N-acetyltransferase [Deinococcus sp. KNUC1210]
MKLRSLQPSDRSAVEAWLSAYLTDHLDWWTRAYGQAPVSDVSALVARDWQEVSEAAGAGRLVAIAELDAVPVGIVRAATRTDRSMGFRIGVLEWIYVAAAARGQGVSSVLMTHALAWMETQDVRGFEVFVTAENGAAVALYQRHGFRTVDFRMLAPRS